MAADDRPDDYVPPALQAQLDAIYARRNAPRAPQFTPEEVSHRRANNATQEQLGYLALLSGYAPMQSAGGHVLKNALAAREKRVGEHGTTDELSGQFTYNPDYLAQRDDDQERQIRSSIAAYQDRDQARRDRREDRATDREQRQQDRVEYAKLTAGLRPNATGTPKLPAEIARMQIGFKALQSTLDEYEDALKHFNPHNPNDQANMVLRAKFNGLQTRLVLEGKEGGALGALSGPDMGLMRSLFPDPFSKEGFAYGKEGLLAQAGQGRNWVSTRQKSTAEQYSLPYEPYEPGSSLLKVPPVDVGAVLAAQPKQALPLANPKPLVMPSLPPPSAPQAMPPQPTPVGMPPPMPPTQSPLAPAIGPDGRPLVPPMNPLARQTVLGQQPEGQW